MKKLVILRRASQAFFLFSFIYLLWLTLRPIVYIPLLFFVAILILTFVIGRFFCGWVCPLGTIIDICGVKVKNRGVNLRVIKYYILGLIVVFAFLGIQIRWIFDPLVITARFVSLNLIPSVTLALDKIFIFLLKSLNFYSPLYDIYRGLKSSILGVKIYYFPHSLITLGFFLFILALLGITKRFWCRVVCPMGAVYSIAARFSLLRRRVDECSHCMLCSVNCRMSAIKEDSDYRKGECILCMDCVYSCPDRATRFTWPGKKTNAQSKRGISRADFLFLIGAAFLLSGFRFKEGAAKKRLIRPPGVTDEREFLNKCVRCGNCMRICPTNGLQPVIFESSIAGIWTPHLVPEIGYCEYNCNLCGRICPTGAIPKLSLEAKKEKKLGTANIDKDICLPWSQNKECIVCQEHCPIPTKAVKIYDEVFQGRKIQKPYVDSSLCIGCGICQNKCPTRPLRAIKVQP
ncbi:MAG: 4Fe-4S dicluster domain-containing protein [Candidatus Omnitrophota bacterium]|nr:4Fe-4S dicluster domain-containing protein [Candidatus Omnitrophota bacterium]